MAISSKFWYQIGYQSISWKYQYQYRYRNFIADKYQYQYWYLNFITEKYQYRIGIEYPYLHGISIVSVSKKVVSKTSATTTHVNTWKIVAWKVFTRRFVLHNPIDSFGLILVNKKGYVLLNHACQMNHAYLTFGTREQSIIIHTYIFI